jgi:uncharacterized protein (AIM24 family)
LGRRAHLLRWRRALHAALLRQRHPHHRRHGAIHEETLGAGETFVVDSGHVVAFENGMTYDLNKFGSWKSTILGGEGVVITFTGPGTLYMQTRSQEAFLGWLIPQLPTRQGDTN